MHELLRSKKILALVSRGWKTSITLCLLSEKSDCEKVMSCSAGLYLAGISGSIFLIFFSFFPLMNPFALVGFAELAQCWWRGAGKCSNRNYQLLCQIQCRWQLCKPIGDTGIVQVSLHMGLACGPNITASDGQWEKSPGWFRCVVHGWQAGVLREHLLFVNSDLRQQHRSTVNLEYHRAS